MSNYTYDTVNSKTVDNNYIKQIKLAIIGVASFVVPFVFGMGSNSSDTFHENAGVYEYRSISVSADTGTNFNAFQSEENRLYNAASTYTNTGAEKSLGTFNDYDERVNSLILQLKEDEENETFFASDYITNLFSQDRAIGILVLNKAFSMESYKYATLVIDAIRLSDVDFLQKWFKALLNIGMKEQEHREYMGEIYELYEEELEAL